jgi:hypothetical protein
MTNIDLYFLNHALASDGFAIARFNELKHAGLYRQTLFLGQYWGLSCTQFVQPTNAFF